MSLTTTREPLVPTPTVIPAADTDFSPLKSKPTTSNFDHDGVVPSTQSQDANVIAVQRKKHLLLTYHERFGHLSFSILRLLARAGIIPRYLADVDPPTCPGCAYGKAIRKQTRYKGVKNQRKIRIANAPGAVVSMDQLVSPTPGFVPIH